MKRSGLFLFFLLVSLILTGSKLQGTVVPFKIVNKSNMDVAVQLVEVEQEQAYYFQLEPGSKSIPTRAEYAIEKGAYTMSVYFIEPYDPVYGDYCEDPGDSKLYAYRTYEVIINQCQQNPNYEGEALIRNKGESPKIKIGTVDTQKDARSSQGPGSR